MSGLACPVSGVREILDVARDPIVEKFSSVPIEKDPAKSKLDRIYEIAWILNSAADALEENWNKLSTEDQKNLLKKASQTIIALKAENLFGLLMGVVQYRLYTLWLSLSTGHNFFKGYDLLFSSAYKFASKVVELSGETIDGIIIKHKQEVAANQLRAIAYSMDALIPGVYLWVGSIRIRIGGAVPDDHPYAYPGKINSNSGVAIVFPRYHILTTYQGGYDPRQTPN